MANADAAARQGKMKFFGLIGHAAALAMVFVLSAPGAALAASLFDELLRRPDDPALNLAFAQEAEAAGKPRHALAAYERAARSGAGAEAERGYARVKRLLSPARTSLYVETGVSYFSNVRENPDGLPRPDDFTFDGGASLIDERTLGGVRLKTLGELAYRIHTEETDLTQIAGGLWTGPVFTLSPKTDLHLAAGGGADWLEAGRTAYSASAKAELTTLYAGAPQKLKLHAARRFVDEDGSIYSDGWFVRASARLMDADLLTPGDAFFLQPRLRWSQPDDDANGRVFNKTNDLADHVDAGARVSYYFPVVDQTLLLGVGAGAYQRWFDQNVALQSGDRRDLQWEATAHAIWRNAFGEDVDLRIDYRFENNDSNDPSEDYVDHVAGFRTMWRF